MVMRHGQREVRADFPDGRWEGGTEGQEQKERIRGWAKKRREQAKEETPVAQRDCDEAAFA